MEPSSTKKYVLGKIMRIILTIISYIIGIVAFIASVVTVLGYFEKNEPAKIKYDFARI